MTYTGHKYRRDFTGLRVGQDRKKGWDICNRDMDGTWRPGMAGTRCYRGMEGTLWENM